jgi:hypothetical protein
LRIRPSAPHCPTVCRGVRFVPCQPKQFENKYQKRRLLTWTRCWQYGGMDDGFGECWELNVRRKGALLIVSGSVGDDQTVCDVYTVIKQGHPYQAIALAAMKAAEAAGKEVGRFDVTPGRPYSVLPPV